MNPLDDVQIIERVKQGEHDVFELLVQRYEPALRRVAYSKLGNATSAEDVVQETFLAVYASRDTYDPRFSFRTWLWTILLNLCKKRRHRRVATENAVPAEAEPADHTTGLQHLLLSERREQVESLLDALPEPQADALRLRFYGELKYQEIADAMASSESGAKRRVKNGLARLAELVRESECLRDDAPSARSSQGPTQ